MKQKIFFTLIFALALIIFAGCTAADTTADDASRNDTTDPAASESESAQAKIPFDLVDLNNISAEYYEENGKCYIKINGIGDINNIDFSQVDSSRKYDPENDILFDWEERHSMIEQIKKGELSKEHLEAWVRSYETDVIELPDITAFEKLSYIEQNKYMSAMLTKSAIQMNYSFEGHPFESKKNNCFYYVILSKEEAERSKVYYRYDRKPSESIKAHGLDAIKYESMEGLYAIEYNLQYGSTKICVMERYQKSADEEQYLKGMPSHVRAFFENEDENLHYSVTVNMPTVTPEPEWFLQFVES